MSKAAGIVRNSDNMVMKWCASVAAAYRELRSNYGTVEYRVEPMDIVLHREQSPAKIQIRCLQDALSLCVAKYEEVNKSKGIDRAMRYQEAGSVLQSMIQELRGE